MVEEVVIDDSGLSEATRENFIGEVIWSRYPCDCEICRRGPIGGDQWHIQIEPLDGTYSQIQHEWYRPSKTKKSAWGMMMSRLVQLGLKGKKISELEGMVFEWEYTEYEIPSGEKKRCWLPKRIVSEEEVEKINEEMKTPHHTRNAI